ncbi:MAG: hypothetical protein M0026_10990 [Nocardiopsaceae bacterium]|nr:hypothetical protein [Nocardiopsaceae bacterium]
MSADRPQKHRSPVILVVSPDEQSAEVTIEGQTHVVSGGTPKETRNAALDAAARYAAHIGASVLVNARDANGAWQLIVSPTGVVRAAGGSEVTLAARPGRRRGIVLAAVGGVLAVAAVAGAGAAAVRILPDITATRVEDGGEAAVMLPGRAAPPGFSQEAAWKLPARPGASPAVTPDGSALAYVDPEERIVVADPDGAELWSDDLPLAPEDIDGTPAFVPDGDEYGLAITGDSTLWQWPAGGGTPDAVELPAESRVTFAGSTPLVLEGESAYLPEGDGLQEVEVPDGYGAMLAEGGRVLTAVRTGPWTWVDTDGTASEVEPDPPAGAEEPAEMLTARQGYVVLLWSAADGGDDSGVLALHDSADGSIVAEAPVDSDTVADASWVRGDSVAAYGPVLIDLDSGAATTLEEFVPFSAAGELVYGEADGAPVAVGADGEPVDLPDNTARPWGVLGGRAIVAAADGLYALLPE